MQPVAPPMPRPVGAGRGRLARRVLLTVSIAVAALVGIDGAVSIVRERTAARAVLRERAELLAEVQVRSLAAALWDYNDAQAEAVVDALTRDPDFRTAFLLDPQDEPLVMRDNGARQPGDIVVERKITVARDGGQQLLGKLCLVLSVDRMERALRTAMLARFLMLGLLLVAVLGAIRLNFRRISGPLQTMTGVMTRLATGDHAIAVPSLGRDDEIGDIARALQVFKEHAIEVEGLHSARERLAAAERERVRAAVESCSDAVAIADPRGRLTYVNPAFEGLLGHTLGEITAGGGALRLLLSPESRRAVLRRLRTAGAWSDEAVLRNAAGQEVRAALRISRINGAGDESLGFVALATDVTERIAAAARLQHQAHHDALTGLPNRVLFGLRLDQGLTAAERRHGGLCVLLLDLDGFKHVNDTFGHSVGDRLLIEVGRRLRSCIAESDTIARIGGDEFAILCPASSDGARAARLAERILVALAVPVACDGQEIDTGTSIGISRFPDDGRNGEALLQSADLALYRAKAQGRGAFRFFEAQLAAEAGRRKRIEQDLRRALHNAELTLDYQPQLDLASGLTVGVEALARWQHPRDGAVSPGDFIPIAEDSGLIMPLGEWVLGEACRWLAGRDGKAASDLRLAVNISAAQFRADLVRMVERVLERTALDPRRLELEITETALLNDTGSTLAQLCQLRAMGIGLALDDFGTGFASLAYLRRFPFSKLKIDRSFIAGLEVDGDAAEIVRSVIMLGHQLRLTVTAEGVETPAQLATLRGLGCDQVQGYLVGRPVPAATLEAGLLHAAATVPTEREPRLVLAAG